MGECVVRRLYISFDQLSGEIPAELANLAHLEYLNLSFNQLSGEIPAELANLSNLKSLDLGDNQLSGEKPAELGNLPNLEDLDLSDNQLSGEIPAELANLSNLEDLGLSDNQLSGEIPAELANLSILEDLDLSDNQLSGEIPIEPGNAPNLSLDGNQLSGRILRPNGINPQYAWDGSTILVSWDAADGADYYKVYYDEISDSNCSLSRDGSPVGCEELAANVVGMSYLHENPSAVNNYYWVVACNSDGCSDIDSKNPAKPIETRPHAPAATPSSTGGAGELAQERAAELLAGELGVAVAGLKVVSTTAMTWSDASLGCPQPDMGYAQVVTPGYLVLFRDSEGTEYKVHTNEDGSSVIVCGK